jgi:hypothetical protein
MDYPEFKPVYILGAGASAMLGTPLLDNFLSRAKDYRHSSNFPQHLIDPFDSVFKYQQEMYQTSEFVGLDLGNIETLFSILDMDCQLAGVNILTDDHIDEWKLRIRGIRKGLVTVVIETIKHFTRYDAKYAKLIRGMAANPYSSFITLNYDLAIEEALYDPGTLGPFSYDYGYPNPVLQFHQTSNIKPILKLHGSANWGTCVDCDFFKMYPGYASSDLLIDQQGEPHKPECSCKQFQNLILPPTWYKSNNHRAITQVWYHAANEIANATHLFIIGYSFPRTDVFFDQLLALGLRDSKNLKRVVVVNHDRVLEDVVKRFFNPHFYRRKVVFLPIYFEQLLWRGDPDEVFTRENILEGSIKDLKERHAPNGRDSV